MEKKNFITLVLGTIGGVLFGLGMCMALLPEWNMFQQGVVVGSIGAVELLITYLYYRKMSGKKAGKINWKIAFRVFYGVFAALVLGVGMSMIMVFEDMMLAGILVGLIGIVLLLCLIPMCLGFK